MQIKYVENMPTNISVGTLYLVKNGQLFYDTLNNRIELGNTHSYDNNINNNKSYYHGKIIDNLIYQNKLIDVYTDTENSVGTTQEYILTLEKPIISDDNIYSSTNIIKTLQGLLEADINLIITIVNDEGEQLFADSYNVNKISQDNNYTDIIRCNIDNKTINLSEQFTTYINNNPETNVYCKIEFLVFEGENNYIIGSDCSIGSGDYNIIFGNKNNLVYNKNSFIMGNNNYLISDTINKDNEFITKEQNQNNCIIGQNNSITNCDEAMIIGNHLDGYNKCVVIGQYGPKADDLESVQYEGAQFIIGDGTDTENRSSFWIKDGSIYGNGTILINNEDYAEYFKWEQIPQLKDYRGLFVTLNKNKIRLANKQDKYILGIISTAPGIIGGNTYDYEENKCISKAENPEWAVVGLMGQIITIDDGTCEEGGFCYPGTNGIATAANEGYYVMERLDDNHIKVLFK